MLSSKDIATLSSDYLERDLGWRQRLRFGMHLLVCGNCRAFIRHFRLSLTLWRQRPHQKLDADQARLIADRAMTAEQSS